MRMMSCGFASGRRQVSPRGSIGCRSCGAWSERHVRAASGVMRGRAPSPRTAGERVALARHEAGLTAKQLAQRLGLSLHKFEQVESGRDAVALYVSSIADATGKPVEWLEGSLGATGTACSRSRSASGRTRFA